MIQTSTDDSNLTGPKPAAPVIVGDEHSYLYLDAKGNVRRRSRPMRILGNLLIAIGMLTLLGVGGWYGYQQWDQSRFIEEFAAEGGIIDPPAVVDANVPTPTSTPLPPVAVL